MATDYDRNFYDTIRAGCIQSAEIVVDLLVDGWDESGENLIIDVGCGEGHWADAFRHHGFDVVGVDGEYVNSSVLPEADFLRADISQPFTPVVMEEAFAVVCLEVAEHLPESRADSFIEELCSMAGVVIFSAAIPGQGGTGHVNEQWPEYWVEKFNNNDFLVTDPIRPLIWNDKRVEPWYRQNILIAEKNVFHLPQHPVPSFIAREVYESRLAEARRAR